MLIRLPWRGDPCDHTKHIFMDNRENIIDIDYLIKIHVRNVSFPVLLLVAMQLDTRCARLQCVRHF